MGKTVTSYPPTRGENSLESIKETELPLKVYLWSAYGENESGKGRSRRQPPSDVSPGSRLQRARAVPSGQQTLKRCFPHQVTRPAGQLTSVCCDDNTKTGRGGGTGWLQAQLCQEFLVLSGVSHFPPGASDPLCQHEENQCSSPSD